MLRELKKRIRTFKNWWRFVPPFNRNRYNAVAELRDGSKILLRDIHGNDYSTLLAIAGDDSYLLSEIKNPNTIVDVGAHIGIFSILTARRFPNAQVFAIEPDTENFQILKENILLNKLSNITPLNVAVAGEYGQASFYSSPQTVGHSIVNSDVGEETKKVETIPLSKFPKIDVLEFDAEGAEYLLSEIPPTSYIAIEVHKIEGMEMAPLVNEIRSKFKIIKVETEKQAI